MPNHVHGIIFLSDTDNCETGMDELQSPVGTRHAVSLPQDDYTPESFGKPVVGSLSTIVRSYKSAVTHSVRQLLKSDDFVVWQSRYHDRIIRNEMALNKLREYIIYNPQSWKKDEFYGE